ncbi:7477_t:CDS:2 [Paraglomus occultum]|uniref:7477_t:CDS:1 n=1 Tax=Paraglomus occultum TaxID=144539 RepID=A0A9N8VSR2_9GLOM|nr:7477_t:CDS:2 [Paraglomus occultum]
MAYLSPDTARNGGGSQISLDQSISAQSSEEISQQDVKQQIENRTANPFLLSLKQLRVMLKRNAILQIRYRKSTIAQIFLGPLIFILLLFILNEADKANVKKSNRHPIPYDLDGVVRCQGRNEGDPCINILFTPDNPENRQILQIFSAKNAQRTGEAPLNIESVNLALTDVPTDNLGIIPVPNAQFIYDYTLQNPNTTLFGIEFTTVHQPTTNYRYQIWFNSTQSANNSDVFSDQIVAFQRGLDEAIIAVATNSGQTVDTTPTFNVQLKDWPKVPPSVVGDEIVGSLGSLFFFCAEMIIFIVVLNTIVTEKEQKLRDSLIMMGLKVEVYWLSYLLSNAWLVIICSIITCFLGFIFRFEVFTNTNFLVLIITFILFGMAMVSFAFFITVWCRKARVAVLNGIFVFIIGLLFQSFVFSNNFVGYIWWDVKTASYFRHIFSLLPFFNFGKIYLDISKLSTGKFDFLTETIIKGPGFKWHDLFNPIPNEYLPTYDAAGRTPLVPPPVQSWYLLLMDIGLYCLLTWYFDKILPDEFGTRRSPVFFLYPSFWGIKFKRNTNTEQLLAKLQKKPDDDDPDYKEDEDVAAERLVAFDPSQDVALRICNLRKVYRQSWLYKSKLDKVAVRDLCLALKEGKCLALLGQNGAGKSTTMNILSGLTPATSGDALLYGYSVRNEMDSIRKIMGVCPQHDILFNDLTAREHIELYAGIKNVPADEIKKLTEERLAAVRLTKVADKPAGTYSGGMKRRLSMLISTIGDPRIIFLDEPTTGMDPVNRRHVWSFIENFKRGRVIVLTTHSMEEADVLGDRISIMAHGRLRALGNAIHLKNRFGAGYRVSLVCHPSDAPLLKSRVEARVSEAKLEDDSAGALIYEIPASSMHILPNLIMWMEDNKEASTAEPTKKLIKAWGVSQKSLEEAFLRLIREANPNGYQGYEMDEEKLN